MALTFCEVYGDIERFIGRMITVQGHIVVSCNKESFMTGSHEMYQRGDCIPVCDNYQIAKQLLASLPLNVGGDCLYDEEAIVTGTIKQREQGICFTDLKSCMIHQDGIDPMILVDLDS